MQLLVRIICIPRQDHGLVQALRSISTTMFKRSHIMIQHLCQHKQRGKKSSVYSNTIKHICVNVTIRAKSNNEALRRPQPTMAAQIPDSVLLLQEALFILFRGRKITKNEGDIEQQRARDTEHFSMGSWYAVLAYRGCHDNYNDPQ